jgi:hypothetical protein
MDAVADADCAGLLLSVTAAVKVEDPDWVGTPEIVPVADASTRPEGKEPEAIDHL